MQQFSRYINLCGVLTRTRGALDRQEKRSSFSLLIRDYKTINLNSNFIRERMTYPSGEEPGGKNREHFTNLESC
jgi:hypothetical protein